MTKKISLIILTLLFFLDLPLSLSAQDSSEGRQPKDPIVKVTAPDSYYAHKVLLFPLELPGYIVRVVTWPLGVGFKFLDEKHVIDKVTNFLSNKEKTFWVYPVIEGGAGSSFGGGVGLSHTDLFHRGYLLGATYRIHINQNQRAALSFGKPNAFYISNMPVSYSFGSNWKRSYKTSYFGVGNSSSQSNESNYDLHDFNTGLTIVFAPIKNVSFIPYLGYINSVAVNSGNSGLPSVGSTFPADQIEGISNRLQYFDSGVRIMHDTRNRLSYPEAGGLRAFTYHHFYCFNKGNFNYNQYEFELNQYIGLWKPRQVLALHTDWNFQSSASGSNGEIPFYRLSTLDASSPLRGFVGGRFHDRNYAVFNAEYRFPVWKLIDGVIFYDTGRVFGSLKSFSFSHLKYSVGGGVKIRVPNFALFRFEMAYGGEGVNFMFGASKPL